MAVGEPDWRAVAGPDILKAAERSGARSVLACPLGFLADHPEVLYDLDVEAWEWGTGASGGHPPHPLA